MELHYGHYVGPLQHLVPAVALPLSGREKNPEERVLYLPNKFAPPVHAEVAAALCSSYPHAAAKGVRLDEQASCRKKKKKKRGGEGQETPETTESFFICNFKFPNPIRPLQALIFSR